MSGIPLYRSPLFAIRAYDAQQDSLLHICRRACALIINYRNVIGACESREAHSHKRPHERSAFDFTFSGSLAMGIQRGEVFSEVGFSVVFCS